MTDFHVNPLGQDDNFLLLVVLTERFSSGDVRLKNQAEPSDLRVHPLSMQRHFDNINLLDHEISATNTALILFETMLIVYGRRQPKSMSLYH